MLTVLAFVVALTLLIAVHEYGHYRMAVACGVRVLRFSIGFGPVLLRWKPRRPRPHQDTEFVLCAIPLGGYVRMLVDSEGPVAEEDQAFEYQRKPLACRAAIVLAGPLANLGLAVVLYALMHWVGEWQAEPILATPMTSSAAEQAGVHSGDRVLRAGWRDGALRDVASWQDLRWQLMQASSDAQGEREWVLALQPRDRSGEREVMLSLPPEAPVDGVMTPEWLGLRGPWMAPVLGDLVPGGVAQQAGLRKGDTVVRIQSRTVPDAAALRARVRESGADGPPASQVWEVARRGQPGLLLVEVQPRRIEQAGVFMGRIDAIVGEPPAQVLVRLGLWEGWTRAIEQTWDVSALSLRTLGRMLLGQASWQQVTGPITMAGYAGKSAALGLSAYLGFLALISVSLGVLNLLPIPVLDGGHLMYHLWEAFTRRRPSSRWLETLNRLGLSIVLLLMLLALRNDLMRWWPQTP
jgi:regulator of sigma E protease